MPAYKQDVPRPIDPAMQQFLDSLRPAQSRQYVSVDLSEEVRQLRQEIVALREAVASTGAVPVAWLEGQEILRGTTPTNLVFLTSSCLLHTREPLTTNPVWPLYAQPPAQDEAVRAEALRIAANLRSDVSDLYCNYDTMIDAARLLEALAKRGEVE